MKLAIRRLWARWRPLLGFSGSGDYWRDRYRFGGDSGAGSGGESARHKADVINAFVAAHGIESVVEFGCGDGRQLQLADFPKYTGYDISSEAVERCRKLFANDGTKRFELIDSYDGTRSDLAISFDVLFHLVEDSVYCDYLDRLFSAADKYVGIHSSDDEWTSRTLPHVRHRPVSRDVAARITGFEKIEYQSPGIEPLPHGDGPPMRFLFYRRIGSTVT